MATLQLQGEDMATSSLVSPRMRPNMLCHRKDYANGIGGVMPSLDDLDNKPSSGNGVSGIEKIP